MSKDKTIYMVDFNGSSYSENSTIQENQSIELFNMMDSQIKKSVDDVIDIGCGSGEVTKNLIDTADPKNLVAVDRSKSQLKMARNHLSNTDIDVKFLSGDILDISFDIDFDLIFSNAALHWVENQKELYEMLSNITDRDGYLAVHQGGEGSYSELHDVASEIITTMGYDMNDIKVPIRYHSIEEIDSLLVSNSFKTLESKMTKTVVDTDEELARAFSEASLLPYREIVNDEQRFVDLFVKNAIGESCRINRLYFIGKKI